MGKVLVILFLVIFLLTSSANIGLLQPNYKVEKKRTFKVLIGYQHGVNRIKARKAFIFASQYIEDELNIKFEVVEEIDINVFTGSRLPHTIPLFDCKAQAQLNRKINQEIDLTYCLLKERPTPGVIGAVNDIGALNDPTNKPVGMSTTDSSMTEVINTLVHELCHILGAHHTYSGIMYYSARWFDKHFILKMSKVTKRQIKEYIEANH